MTPKLPSTPSVHARRPPVGCVEVRIRDVPSVATHRLRDGHAAPPQLWIAPSPQALDPDRARERDRRRRAGGCREGHAASTQASGQREPDPAPHQASDSPSLPPPGRPELEHAARQVLAGRRHQKAHELGQLVVAGPSAGRDRDRPDPVPRPLDRQRPRQVLERGAGRRRERAGVRPRRDQHHLARAGRDQGAGGDAPDRHPRLLEAVAQGVLASRRERRRGVVDDCVQRSCPGRPLGRALFRIETGVELLHPRAEADQRIADRRRRSAREHDRAAVEQPVAKHRHRGKNTV